MVCLVFSSNKDNKDMLKIAFLQVFDNSNVNLHKSKGFLTSFHVSLFRNLVNQTQP